MARTVNQNTIDLIKHFEGYYPEAYKCEAGVWTIGWGHTGLVHEDGTVYKGRKITREKAEELLKHDMSVFAPGVEKLLFPRVLAELNDNQFGALVSLAFNIGLGAFKKSTVLARVNARRYSEVTEPFLRWNRADGRVQRGLTRRRKSEANLFHSLPNFIVKA